MKKNSRQPDISVIIPCYNVGKYIDECVDSVMVQKNIKKCEIICVNDGSSDDTLKRLTKFERKYPTVVKVVNKRHNQGVSMARNDGIAKSTGKEIMFLDGDDYIGGQISDVIDTHYLEAFHDTLSRNPLSGMAVGNILVANQTKSCPIFNDRFDKLFKYQSKNKIGHSRTLDFLDTRISSCAILFRKNVIRNNNLLFSPELTYFEDANFVTSYAIASTSEYRDMLSIVPNFSFYIYRRRPDSAMTKLSRHSEKYMRRLERTKDQMIHYSLLLLRVHGLLGDDSHIYNILAHRASRIAKNIRGYAKACDADAYEALSKYLPHKCAGCMENRCQACKNNSELLRRAEMCKMKLFDLQKKY